MTLALPSSLLRDCSFLRTQSIVRETERGKRGRRGKSPEGVQVVFSVFSEAIPLLLSRPGDGRCSEGGRVGGVPEDVVRVGVGRRGQWPVSPTQGTVKGSSFVDPSLVYLQQGAGKRRWLGFPGD
jgi:hypothetical protein